MAHRNRRFTIAAVALPLLFLVMSGMARAATFTVTNTGDSNVPGSGSLRDAINSANATPTVANTINFSVSGTITLGSTLPAIANTSPGSLTIDGSGQAITVDGASMFRILTVNSGSTLNLGFLTLTKGSVGASGGGGGAIFNNGTMTITNSTFSGNQAGGDGAAIENTQGTLSVTNSTFSANQTVGGGAINNALGLSRCSLKGSILTGNTGGNCGGPTAVTDAGYNISDDASCSFGGTSKNNDTMLNLGTLANNGGPTQTIAIGSGSSAIGFDTDCTDQQSPTPKPVLTDQRNFIRPNSPTMCDSGAYEHDGVPPIAVVPNTERLQIARSSTPNSDQVNLSLSFTEPMIGPDCMGEDVLRDGLMVALYEGTCANMTSGPLSVDLNPFVVHTINHQTYGTFFDEVASETVSARMALLGMPANTCGEWSLNLEIGGLDTMALGLGGTNPFALVLTDDSGVVSGCFDIDNAIVGNQITLPAHGVRRGSRRGRR